MQITSALSQPLTSTSLMAGAEKTLASVQQLMLGDPAEIKLDARTSLVSDVKSLKAQQKALDLLDNVLAAARGVFSQLPTLVENGQGAEAGPGNAVDKLLNEATHEEAPLFDTSVLNSRSLEQVLAAPEGSAGLNLFSDSVRASLRSAFDQAFDIYA